METLNLLLILAFQTPWNRLDLQHELGPLKAPGAIALGPADSLFVLERYPAHLEIFSRNGTCDQVALAWPEDFVQDPIAMLVRENQVWISEDTTRSLWCFDDQGQFRVQIDFGLWGGSPGHLAQATDGIWVVDRFLKLLLRLDTVSFQIVEAQKIPEMVREPGALCLTPQGPVIVDEMSQSLTNLSTQSGFGAWGDPPGFFDGPTDLVWQDGLWVCDRNNHRLQKFSLEGQLLGCWGSHELWPHQGQGWLHYPDQIVPWLGGWAVLEKLEARIQIVQVSDQPAKGSSNTKPHFGPQLAFHPQGFMAATDPAHARILIYDLQRTIPVLIHQFGSRGEAPHQFNRLSSMTFCGDRLAVWDERFRRITWFGFDFQPEEEVRYNPRLSRFIKSEPLPKGVPDGSILLFGTGPNLVLVNPEHAWVALMEERSKDWIPLTPPGGWLQPSDVEVDPEGTLWVLDSSSKKNSALFNSRSMVKHA
ncbi:MAG: hypothetical protein KDC71_17075 [Acidobacteria bacterium]|nr:hypothetical protein [Acidobacteriota bacterium]